MIHLNYVLLLFALSVCFSGHQHVISKVKYNVRSLEAKKSLNFSLANIGATLVKEFGKHHGTW